MVGEYCRLVRGSLQQLLLSYWLLKWIVQRAVAQLESHTEKIDALEKTTVTRLELEAALKQLRADRLVMHQENVAHLIRIENKIEESDKREPMHETICAR